MVIRSDDIEAKLQSLKAECDRLDVAFDKAVVNAGFANKYELFRLADGDNWPPELETIWQARRAAYEAFFLCRDGDKEGRQWGDVIVATTRGSARPIARWQDNPLPPVANPTP